jgi:hypothetical protein
MATRKLTLATVKPAASNHTESRATRAHRETLAILATLSAKA